MYVAMGTRPDIAQVLDNPGWEQWEVIKQIFRYLKGSCIQPNWVQSSEKIKYIKE